MEQFLAYVAVENVAYHFDILYGYAVPEKMKDDIKPGVRVQVPFGRGTSQRQGFVFSVGTAEADSRYKYISSVLDKTAVLTDEMLQIAHFLKDRTFCTYYEAVKVQLPTGFNFKMNVTYVALATDEAASLSKTEKAVYDYMLENAVYFTKEELYGACNVPAESNILDRLVSKGVVIRNYEAVGKVGNLSVKIATLCDTADGQERDKSSLTDKQKSVLSVLEDVGSASVKELCYFTGVTGVVVSNLEKKGFIKISDRDVFRRPDTYMSVDKAETEIALTKKQMTAYEKLQKQYQSGGGVSLLYGITGSGKTSVFIRLIDDVLKDGREVIVMVPEISLTPQMMAVFKARYGEQVAIFHSGLSVGERKDEYRRVRCGQAKIAVGTRSAVFAPFQNLGLIVMDEEQEHTYKSESSPRYHAREVAKFRAKYHGALLLLASATPSMESYSLAKSGKYSLAVLDERYGDAILPAVEVIDLKADCKAGNKYSLSTRLQSCIEDNLNNKKQTILLMNRRGYNTFAECSNCGEVITCPSCSISLTFHRANGRLMCHYCGYSRPFTIKCSHCGKERVRYAGYGTQRVEEEIEKLFPQARVLRLDADSAVSREKFEKSLSDFSKGEYDILLGTQMVAKGLNFENVTLVGVINADTQLYNDDFRSSEITFDLLTQVVGRSGRGKEKGIALIQTQTPENNVIQLAKAQDYESFYNEEITIRKALTYPPFCDICALSCVSESEHKAYMASKSLLASMTELLEGEYKALKLIILQPMPPRISKINNKFKYRIIVKCKNNKLFRKMISELLTDFGKSKAYADVSFYADINPESLI